MFTQALNDALTAVDQRLFSLIAALAGVGIFSMAMLQLIKDIFPARRLFQRSWFTRWFTERAALAGQEKEAGDALDDLIRLATAGDARALYDLPVENFTGQVNAASQAILDYPAQHEPLLRIVACGAAAEDIEELLEGPPSPDSKEAVGKYVDARNRVSHYIQRSLDAIQIAMGGLWRLILHGLSIALSAVFVFVALTYFASGEIWTGPRVVYALVLAVLSGFVAPVARDMVAALERLRARPR